MSHVSTPTGVASALVVFSLLACGGGSRATSVPGPTAPVDQTPRVLTATCQSYDANAGTMKVITGVSFALRVVTFRVDDSTQLSIRGAPADLAEMVDGSVVRIHYHRTPEGNMADRIEEVMNASEMR
jgi:hypothetical protein